MCCWRGQNMEKCFCRVKYSEAIKSVHNFEKFTCRERGSRNQGASGLNSLSWWIRAARGVRALFTGIYISLCSSTIKWIFMIELCVFWYLKSIRQGGWENTLITFWKQGALEALNNLDFLTIAILLSPVGWFDKGIFIFFFSTAVDQSNVS